MGVLSIEEEYWTIQYLTNVAGHRERIFWPLDGEGKYSTEAVAVDRAATLLDGHYDTVRVVHVVRSMKFGQPIVKPQSAGDS